MGEEESTYKRLKASLAMYQIELDYFAFILKVLRFGGIYASENAGYLYRLVMLINLCIVFPQLIFELNYIVHAPDGALDAIKCTGAASFRTLSIARLVHFMFRKRVYLKIWHSLNRPSFKFDHFYFDAIQNAKALDYFEFDHENNYDQLKRYWGAKTEFTSVDANGEKQKEVDDVYKNILMKYRLISYGVFTFLISGTTLSLLSSFMSVFVKPVKINFDEDLQRDVAVNELPYRILIPFMDLKDPFQYKMAMIFEAYAISYISYAFLIVDFLFQGYLIHLTGQVLIIHKLLERIQISTDSLEDVNQDRVTNAQLVKCIEELQQITLIQEEIEEEFNKPMLIQYAFCSLIMVTCIYTIPLETDPAQLFGTLTFAFLATYHPFMSSVIANMLHQQFENIPTSFYNLQWYNGSESLKQKIFYAIFRYQKPMDITIGKFIPVDLVFFTAYMQKIYSIYALLNSVNSAA